MVNPQLSGLPGFLTKNPGLHSGLMIAQYTAASLVSENKVLAHPASVDSIPSSANQEDHVSMGAVSARKCAEIVNNVKYTLAIELLAAAQALDIGGRVEGLSERMSSLYKAVRLAVPYLESDRVLSPDIEIIKSLIDSGAFSGVATF